MTRLAVIGDVHKHLFYLEVVCDWIGNGRFDGVLLVGDLADGGHVARPRPREAWAADVRLVLDRVRELGVPVLAVPGNHDQVPLPDAADVDGRVTRVGPEGAGLRVGGLGGAGPMRFGFPNEWTEEDAAASLKALDHVHPDGPPDVLLSHAPPWGARDRTASGSAAGSHAVRSWAERRAGFVACGHIHEAGGVERVGDCLVVNAGGLGRPFGKPQAGWIARDERGDSVGWIDLETKEQRTLTRPTSGRT